MSPTPYQESEDHVPNPLYQTGVVDTTGVTGDLGGRIENISPVFAQAKAAAFNEAVDAVDEGDDAKVDETVVFHADETPDSREEEVENLRQAAEDAAANPQLENPALTPAAQEAAEEGDSDQAAQPSGTNTDTVSAPDGPKGSSKSSSKSSSGDSDLPADSDSKAKWVEYAEANKLDVDQGLVKDEYVKAVKKAKK